MKNILPITGLIIILLCAVFLTIVVAGVKPGRQDVSKTKNGHTASAYSFNAAALSARADSLVKEGKADDAVKLYEKIALESPNSPQAAQAYYKLGQLYAKSSMLLAARESYKKCVYNFPNSPFLKDSQEKLWQLNIALLFSPAKMPESSSYKVQPGDTLVKIAKKFNTTPELLAKSNKLKGSALFAGQALKVPNVKFSLIVSKTQNTMMLKANEEVFKIYNVATGKDGCSPVGTFKIVNKLSNPVWFHEGKSYPPEAKENILGTRWLGIDKPGYGIHGTTEPESIGKQATNGCVRMVNNEVEELYDIMPVGSQVIILE